MQSTGCVACGRPRHSDLLLQCGKLPVLRLACAGMGQQGQFWCASSAQRFERSRQGLAEAAGIRIGSAGEHHSWLLWKC